MSRLQLWIWRTAGLGLFWLTLLPAGAKVPPRATNGAGAAVKEARARALVARFDRGDPGWKVRMEALALLVRAGPATVPVLVEALDKGSPSAREFAAHALGLFADPSTRSALERALADSKAGVRIYAILALSMIGPLPRNERFEQILREDPTVFGAQPMMAAALGRDDRPNPEGLRKALAEYDLRGMDSARVGEIAPDFTLASFTGKTTRLSQFRGRAVVLRFILFDF
jgi:hypothetical protein